MSNITSGSSSGGDVYARCKTGSNTAGRGSEAGWTPCPLCNNNSLLLDSSVINDDSCISSLAGGGGILNVPIGKFLPFLCCLLLTVAFLSLCLVLCISCVLFFAISIFYWL